MSQLSPEPDRSEPQNQTDGARENMNSPNHNSNTEFEREDTGEEMVEEQYEEHTEIEDDRYHAGEVFADLDAPAPAPLPQSSASGSNLSCPYCRDTIESTHSVSRCYNNHAFLHRECAEEVRRCPAVGCNQRLTPAHVSHADLRRSSISIRRDTLWRSERQRSSRSTATAEVQSRGLSWPVMLTLLALAIGGIAFRSEIANLFSSQRPKVRVPRKPRKNQNPSSPKTRPKPLVKKPSLFRRHLTDPTVKFSFERYARENKDTSKWANDVFQLTDNEIVKLLALPFSKARILVVRVHLERHPNFPDLARRVDWTTENTKLNGLALLQYASESRKVSNTTIAELFEIIINPTHYTSHKVKRLLALHRTTSANRVLKHSIQFITDHFQKIQFDDFVLVLNDFDAKAPRRLGSTFIRRAKPNNLGRPSFANGLNDANKSQLQAFASKHRFLKIFLKAMSKNHDMELFAAPNQFYVKKGQIYSRNFASLTPHIKACAAKNARENYLIHSKTDAFCVHVIKRYLEKGKRLNYSELKLFFSAVEESELYRIEDFGFNNDLLLRATYSIQLNESQVSWLCAYSERNLAKTYPRLTVQPNADNAGHMALAAKLILTQKNLRVSPPIFAKLLTNFDDWSRKLPITDRLLAPELLQQLTRKFLVQHPKSKFSPQTQSATLSGLNAKRTAARALALENYVHLTDVRIPEQLSSRVEQLATLPANGYQLQLNSALRKLLDDHRNHPRWWLSLFLKATPKAKIHILSQQNSSSLTPAFIPAILQQARKLTDAKDPDGLTLLAIAAQKLRATNQIVSNDKAVIAQLKLHLRSRDRSWSNCARRAYLRAKASPNSIEAIVICAAETAEIQSIEPFLKAHADAATLCKQLSKPSRNRAFQQLAEIDLPLKTARVLKSQCLTRETPCAGDIQFLLKNAQIVRYQRLIFPRVLSQLQANPSSTDAQQLIDVLKSTHKQNLNTLFANFLAQQITHSSSDDAYASLIQILELVAPDEFPITDISVTKLTPALIRTCQKSGALTFKQCLKLLESDDIRYSQVGNELFKIVEKQHRYRFIQALTKTSPDQLSRPMLELASSSKALIYLNPRRVYPGFSESSTLKALVTALNKNGSETNATIRTRWLYFLGLPANRRALSPISAQIKTIPTQNIRQAIWVDRLYHESISKLLPVFRQGPVEGRIAELQYHLSDNRTVDVQDILMSLVDFSSGDRNRILNSAGLHAPLLKLNR